MERLEKSKELIGRLEEAINLKDNNAASYCIQELIRWGIKVSISPSFYEKCSSHIYIYPGSENLYSPEFLYSPFICDRSHHICYYCLQKHISSIFLSRGLNFRYECPACENQEFRNSRFFAKEKQYEGLMQLVGIEMIQEWERRNFIKPEDEEPEIPFLQTCENCSFGYSDLHKICLDNHKVCNFCLINNINSTADDGKFVCKVNGCKKAIYHEIVKAFIEIDQNLIQKFWKKLKLNGKKCSFCPNCKINIELDKKKTEELCVCGAKICVRCTQTLHDGLSCYNVAGLTLNDPPFIDIYPPPRDFSDYEYLHEEYENAKFAFETFVRAANLKMTQVKLVVNPALEQKFEAKKKQLGCKEEYVFHGSNYVNYAKICSGGFIIGGTNGLAVAHGTAAGYGVYTGLTPDISAGYAQGKTWMLCCRAVRGICGAPARTVQELTAGNRHSTQNGDALIFFSADQVLPKYLVEFTQR
ncbi:unnamed protein product [Blepharisma stoltei]|uniref:PARP catalytic domain-containing protein n=1 Tax=Blepharisma stoltei TaxID=1481888 RepID=A0AAU9IIP8_9CILI|nr:unnamed protein product [Blepharisma stoltei]